MKFFLKLISYTFLLFGAIVFGLTSLAQAQVRSLNLEEMVKHSGTIVVGQVLNVHQDHHPQYQNIAVTMVTVKVTEALLGKPGKEFTFMQYGGTGKQAIADLPKYRVGEEVMLFLHPESKVGFTSPVGAGQGKFTIEADENGQHIARNEQGNRSLFQHLAPHKGMQRQSLQVLASPQAPLKLESLTSLVKDLLK